MNVSKIKIYLDKVCIDYADNQQYIFSTKDKQNVKNIVLCWKNNEFFGVATKIPKNLFEGYVWQVTPADRKALEIILEKPISDSEWNKTNGWF